MKEHPIAAGLWLTLVAGLIGLGATKGTEASAQHRIDEERAALDRDLVKAIDLGRRGDYAEAVGALEALIAEHPGEASLHLNLGVAYRAADKSDEADRSFTKVLELNPNDYDALAERASIQLEKGNADAAIQAVEKIPPHEGRMRERLMDDPHWVGLTNDPRVKALRDKHAVETYDTSLGIERQRRKGAPQGVMIP